MDIRFTTVFTPQQVDEIVSLLIGPRLGIIQHSYPNFDVWGPRTYRDLMSGHRCAMVAFCESEMVGVTIYRPRPGQPELLDIRNVAVRVDWRGRHIASFLLRNTELEAQLQFPSIRRIRLDSKVQNIAMTVFLKRHGYQVIGRTDLYRIGVGEDLIFEKTVRPAQWRFPTMEDSAIYAAADERPSLWHPDLSSMTKERYGL